MSSCPILTWLDCFDLSLALSSNCLRNFLYLCQCLFYKKFYHFLSFTVRRAKFHEIDPLYANRQFYPSMLWHCWLGYVVCINTPRNELLCVGVTLNRSDLLLMWPTPLPLRKAGHQLLFGMKMPTSCWRFMFLALCLWLLCVDMNGTSTAFSGTVTHFWLISAQLPVS